MGEHNATKADLHELARGVGTAMAELDARLHSLALCFDVIVTVLGVEEKVKAELKRRQDEAEAKQKAAQSPIVQADKTIVSADGKTPLVSVP